MVTFLFKIISFLKLYTKISMFSIYLPNKSCFSWTIRGGVNPYDVCFDQLHICVIHHDTRIYLSPLHVAHACIHQEHAPLYVTIHLFAVSINTTSPPHYFSHILLCSSIFFQSPSIFLQNVFIYMSLYSQEKC